MANTALVKGDSRKKNIHDALYLIKEDIKKSLDGKKSVLIKPNLTALDNRFANTDIETMESVIDFINDIGDFDITIGESSGSAYYSGKTTWDVFRHFGYDKLTRKYPNARLVDFDEVEHETIRIPVETVHGMDEIKAIKPPCDYTISLAIPKTHDYAIGTFSMKNMMGLVAREDRLKIHGLSCIEDITSPVVNLVPKKIQYFLGKILPEWVVNLLKNMDNYKQNVCLIHKNLLSLFKEIKPDLSVIDGYYGMEGNGPISGDRIKHGIAIAGLDPVKADAVTAACIGFMPTEIGYLYYCALEGIGSLDISDVTGLSPSDVMIKYKPHHNYKYQKEWR